MEATHRHLVIVPHTHWDREWYRTHEQFRYRLVSLVDGLLELLESNPEFRCFTLDGQTVVVDDYLEVRPRARERIAKLVREGRLLVGPWYVLPDEWLVSGEALIRNLRLGLRKAAELGAVMRLGYVPDQFGHVGQLPQIFEGFGFEAAALWRGVGEDVDRTLFWWEAPDGSRMRTVYLVRGYGNAIHLPRDPSALARRLVKEADALASFSSIPTLLLMNGGDHQPPCPELPHALAAAVEQVDGLSAEIGGLQDFVARASAEAGDDLPVHRGELRSGLRAPLLPGCASARAPQKRSDFENDRLLTRYLEPLAAWLGALGAHVDSERIEFVWRVALENHPHDSICGCSIDEVHEQMEGRFRRVRQIAQEQLTEVTGELARRVAVPRGGYGAGARRPLIAWNPGASGRMAVETELELDVPLDPKGRPRSFHLRSAGGGRIPVTVEVRRPSSRTRRLALPRGLVAELLPGFGREFNARSVNAVETRREGKRLEAVVQLGETPDSDFDEDATRARLAELVGDETIEEVSVEAYEPPRLGLRFVDELPGCGLRTYRLARGEARSTEPLLHEALPDGGGAIENGTWRAEADGEGRFTLYHRPSGIRMEDALRLVSEGDRGDEYNFDPVPGAPCVERAENVRCRTRRLSGGEVALALACRYRVPLELADDRARRSSRTVVLPARLELRLLAGLDRLDLVLDVDNRARDHRLRLLCRVPFEPERFEVDSAFEVVGRPVAPKRDAFGVGRLPAEYPIGSVPQRSFATLAGRAGWALTVANRGVAEVEAVPAAEGEEQGAHLALTVLRAVGWLSRADLGLRPAPAGPLLPTPGAQVPGPHRAELSLRLHELGDARRAAEAHAFAHPPLAFLGVEGAPGPLRDGSRLVAVDDPAVTVCAIEPRPERSVCVRLVNASDAERRFRLGWGGGLAGPPEAVNLWERPVADAPARRVGDADADVELGAWKLLTLRWHC